MSRNSNTLLNRKNVTKSHPMKHRRDSASSMESFNSFSQEERLCKDRDSEVLAAAADIKEYNVHMIAKEAQNNTQDLSRKLLIVLAVFSATGVLFLLFIATLLLRQPFLVSGIPVHSSREVARTAHKAAACYLTLLIVCTVHIIRPDFAGYEKLILTKILSMVKKRMGRQSRRED